MTSLIPDHIANNPRLQTTLQALASDPVRAARAGMALADPDLGEQAELRRRRRAATYQRSRPGRYATADLPELMPQQNPDAKVTRWLDGPAQQLVLAGPSGRGKSHAAWAVTNTASNGGMFVVGWQVADLTAHLAPPGVHDRYDEVRSDRREKTETRLFSAELLLLDDLGREDGGPRMSWWHTLLFRVVDHRLNEGLRTIVTFNAADHSGAGQVLSSRYGDHLYTRLVENAWWVWVDGQQLRRSAPVPPWTEGGDLR